MAPASVEADHEREVTTSPREKENGGPNLVEVFTRGGRKVRPPPRFLIWWGMTGQPFLDEFESGISSSTQRWEYVRKRGLDVL